MKGYNQIAEYAIAQYDKLPQEGSQLYNKHFITIPFELKKNVDAEVDADEEMQGLRDLINGELKGLKIRFDAAVGSSGHLSLDNNHIKIKSADKLGVNELKGRLHDSSEDKYIAFIDAYSKNFVLIDVPDGDEARLNLLFSNSTAPLNAQVIIRVGNGSTLNLFELYASRAASISSLGTIHEVRIGKNSAVEINGLHNENADTVALGFCKGAVGEESQLRFNSFYNGGSYTRIRNRMEAVGSGSTVDANELVFGSVGQRFDINTFMVNEGTGTIARLESKAALMDNSICMLKGFAKIEKGAKESESYVHERGILLDKGAKIDELPDMSIDENEVKAGHSASAAPMDPETIFYLMSKGIDETGIRKLVVEGFFSESLSKFNNRIMREVGLALIRNKIKNKVFGQAPRIDSPGGDCGTERCESDVFKGYRKI
jgi:Fe-S cluster assembly scaffold protein SufB